MRVKIKLTIVFVLVAGLTKLACSQPKIHSTEKQIEAAISAAPDSQKPEATVLGYDKEGELIMLREGNNPIICVADDPEQANFHVSCYHKDLEHFMKRGRELKAQGMDRKKIDSIRRKEIEEGTLTLPRKPMALYSLTGSAKAYDYQKEIVNRASALYVVYVPYATEQTTGLSAKPPHKGAPWIMEPGTPWAHIMVIPEKKVGNHMSSDS